LGNLSSDRKWIYPHCQSPELPKPAGDVTAVLAILHQFCEAPGHHFWIEDISILNIFESDAITTHAQITDVYLLKVEEIRQALKDRESTISQNSLAVILRKMAKDGTLEQPKYGEYCPRGSRQKHSNEVVRKAMTKTC